MLHGVAGGAVNEIGHRIEQGLPFGHGSVEQDGVGFLADRHRADALGQTSAVDRRHLDVVVTRVAGRSSARSREWATPAYCFIDRSKYYLENYRFRVTGRPAHPVARSYIRWPLFIFTFGEGCLFKIRMFLDLLSMHDA